ncbi:MAG: sugar ABC transporter substrate-binding protein [Opitutae bacterium]|nr:sugar ABC transporter substrate-binding protein [Opitutae bacterium]
MRTLLLVLTLIGIIAHSSAAPGKIGALMLNDGPFWTTVEKGVKAGATAGGLEAATIIPPITNGATQAKYLSVLAAQKPGVILFNPSWQEQTNDAMKSCLASGIKLIALEGQLPAEVPHLFVGHDRTGLGKTGAKLLVSLATDSDEVGFLRVPNQKTYTDNELEAIKAMREHHPKAIVRADIFGRQNRSENLAQAVLLLQKYPQLRIVYTTSSGSSIDMLQALKQTGRAGKVRFIGFGVSLPAEVAAAIENGTIEAWIAQNPYAVGRKAAELAAALLDGKTVPEVSYVDAMVVTKQNLRDPQVQELLSH